MSTISTEELRELVESKDPSKQQKYGSLADIAKALGSDLEKGLSDERVIQNRKTYGINKIPDPPVKTLLQLILEGLEDKTLIMLMISSVVSLVLGFIENPKSGWIEGTAILVAVFIVVMVSALNDYSKEQQFRKLNAKKNNKLVKVIRDGETKQVSVYDIVVGDIVNIEVGDILCADGLFISGFDMKCDEANMTGEPDAVKKDTEHNILFSSCQVLEGVGKMIVVAVGPNSQSGSIMLSLQVRASETPLQMKLESLSDKIAKLGLLAAFSIFCCLIIKLIYHIYIGKQPLDLSLAYAITNYIISSITVVVVAVPEGLPLAVTIALAYSMGKMLRDNNLVRHLDACETMGGATTICSDKTGTLTQNKMTVTKVFFCHHIVDIINDLDKVKELFSSEYVKTLTDNISINSAAYESKDENGKATMVGNRTDCALVNFVSKLGVDYQHVRDSHEKIGFIPFSSKRKRMSTVVNNPDYNKNGLTMYTKGASEIILALCTQEISEDGKTAKPLDAKKREEIVQTINDFANQTLRTICIAQKPFDKKETELTDDDENNLIFIGMVGIKDPIRPEVPAAVKACQDAGIIVRMVTGDNVTTATAIAKECGIVTGDNDLIIEGPVFAKLSEEELIRKAPKLRVMARSSPNDKLTLVNTLKSLGHVVAVTGDGTNDAPALKSADVGFAMGIAGTEVSKEASDIILMDDNFTSTVKAVSWGRNVFDSIRKFLQFQITVNIVAVAVAFIGSVVNEKGESPLTPVQLLWVNLIMDTMAALALATDDPTPELLQRKPYGKTDGLITLFMWRNIITQAIFQLVINILCLYFGSEVFGVQKGSIQHSTIVFNLFVLCQVFNEINSRKLKDELNVFKGIFSNSIFAGIMIFTIVMQFLIVTFGGDFANTRPLTLNQWLMCLGIASISLIISFFSKLFIPLGSYVAKQDEAKHSSSEEILVNNALAAAKKDKATAHWNTLKKNVVKPNFAQVVRDAVRFYKKSERCGGMVTKAQYIARDFQDHHKGE